MPKSPEQPAKPSKGKEPLEGCVIEYDSRYRGKLEKDAIIDSTSEIMLIKIAQLEFLRKMKLSSKDFPSM